MGCIVVVVSLQLVLDFSAFFSTSDHPEILWWMLCLVLPLFGSLFAVGIGTRVCAIICWICIVVVQDSNLFILSGADRLLRLLLFWSIFLPLDSTWSLQTWLHKKPRPRLPLTDYWAAWAITLQICFVYWYAALAKSDPLWTQSHNALFYALSIDYLVNPGGHFLWHYPSLLRALTALTLVLEFAGPFLLFVPFHRDRFRLLAVIIFTAFHLIGIQFLFRLGFFPWVAAASWLIFIPPFFWDTVTGSLCVNQATIPSPKWARLLDRSATSLVFLCLADVLIGSGPSLWASDFGENLRARDPLQPILHLDQRWRMFSPLPDDNHGWLVIPASLADGSQVDLFTGQPVLWSKPPDIGDYFGDYRWISRVGHIIVHQDPADVQQFGDYLVNKWNAEHPLNKVQSISIVYMQQWTLPNLTITDPAPLVLYTHKY